VVPARRHLCGTDGSLIVADWYDPGVGGHAAGDQLRGRVYRVAPANAKYTIPQLDYNTPAGAVQALQNPNLSVRYRAWTALQTARQTCRSRTGKAVAVRAPIPACGPGPFGRW
jgi:hypothetical protein